MHEVHEVHEVHEMLEVHEVLEVHVECGMLSVNFGFGPFRSMEVVLENGFEN